MAGMSIGSPSTWVTLTVAGLAMGLIIFVIASGLTLVFGLMDVLNFGHGVFIALGAFMATSVMGWTAGPDGPTVAGVFAAMFVAMAVAGAAGWAFERVIVRPVYGLHLKQILITMGGMIVGEELIKVIWGPLQIALPLPQALRGAWYVGEAAIERYRVLACGVGLLVFLALAFTLNRTKLGLLIRAGVQDRSMVEALGYRIQRLFVGVFVGGSALAGLLSLTPPLILTPTLLPITADAQIISDAAAPAHQQAIVSSAANGVPLVHIQTPTAGGVSRNAFTQFDVQSNGVILNNAHQSVQTALGGWVQANPMLDRPASVIVNEVNSSHPSLLHGYAEVAGQRAQVIIANPSGISCDGCGFINASPSGIRTVNVVESFPSHTPSNRSAKNCALAASTHDRSILTVS
jgi:filamentous hemagglutinin family protein